MRAWSGLAAVILLLCLSVVAQANISIDTVPVGNPGNSPDTRYATPGYGSVSYTYSIGKYEVTTAQYTDFLNNKAKTDPHGLYDPVMSLVGVQNNEVHYGCNIQRGGDDGHYTYSVAADWANRPVNLVTYWDACRFANWLTNGQGTGDTETGAYTLLGYMGDDGRTIQRNPGAKWYVPSEDEWYKAAYYKGGSRDAGYRDYPYESDMLPSNQVLNPDPGHNANFYDGAYSIGDPYLRTTVGEFENTIGPYGTYDQGGNVWEWDEALIFGAKRGLRGGSNGSSVGSYDLKASTRNYFYSPSGAAYDVGFRVVQVPEPSSLVALASGLGMLLGMRRRRRK